MSRCGRGCCCRPGAAGFGGRLGHRALRGVDVLGRRVKQGVDVRLCHHGTTVLRALTAAMRIAQKRNRSPQNGAGRDDGSSQCSLLW